MPYCKIKLSIIVVCLNASKVIEKTLDSLVKQTYMDYELIIKDGLSKDATMEIIDSYISKIKNVKVIAKKDSGIYDAMNQAVTEAQGEYVYFLNAGDILYSENTLKNVVDELDCDVVYGDMIYGDSLLRQPKKISKMRFVLERMICHQSIFSKRELLLKYPFECKYKYCADRHWLYTCFSNKVSIKHIDEVIGNYDMTGVSSEWSNFSGDSLNVVKDEFGVLGELFVRLKRTIGRKG